MHKLYLYQVPPWFRRRRRRRRHCCHYCCCHCCLPHSPPHSRPFVFFSTQPHVRPPPPPAHPCPPQRCLLVGATMKTKKVCLAGAPILFQWNPLFPRTTATRVRVWKRSVSCNTIPFLRAGWVHLRGWLRLRLRAKIAAHSTVQRQLHMD